MKLIVQLFIIFQLADIITTMIGLSIGLHEWNALAIDWNSILSVKLIVIVAVSAILQIKRSSWLDWIPVGISGAVVAWNVLNLLTSIV